MSTFFIQNRVYYEDTDAGGIVYHANYLKFMERARTEWVRSLGLNQHKLLEQSIGFVVIDMSIKFKGSAKLDDLILSTCHVKASKRASIVFEQEISRVEEAAFADATAEVIADSGADSGADGGADNTPTSIDNKNNQVLVKAEVKVACVNLQTQKPIAIPADLLREMRSDV